MAAYDLLARHYDAVTGDCATEAAFVDHVLSRARPRPVTVLEAACGTGGIIASLAGRYRVAGLDLSPGMLAVAREKLPRGTPLHLADMSRFRLGVRFDAVICVYHGVNHLLGFPAWESFFDRAAEHLNDGGMFVFDLLTPGNLQTMASSPPMIQRFGRHYLRLAVHAGDRGRFGWNIEVLERQRDGGYRSLTEVIETASFPPARIRAALGQRFAGVQIIESDGGIAGDGENRTWFVGTKPGPATRPRRYSGPPGPPGGSR